MSRWPLMCCVTDALHLGVSGSAVVQTLRIQRSLITTYLVLVITKGYEVLETTIKSQNAFAPTVWCALRKFHVIDSPNAPERSNCVRCILFILLGSPNEADYINATHA